MPSADSGMVPRQNMPTAMASCSHGMSGESVFSSGVRMMPPMVQSATKNAAVPAR